MLGKERIRKLESSINFIFIQAFLEDTLDVFDSNPEEEIFKVEKKMTQFSILKEK